MTLILTVLHVLVCMSLVFVVLLQKGSGADMGAAFGGSSQSLFGARGSGDFLSKLTAGLATVFMITSLTLAFFSTRPGAGVSVMDKAVTTQSQSASGKESSAPATEPVQESESGPPVPAKSAPVPSAPASSAPAASDVSTPSKPVPAPPEAAPEAAKPEAPAKPVVPSEAGKKNEPSKEKKAVSVP